MKLQEKGEFLKRGMKTLESMYDLFADLGYMALSDLEAEKTALIIIDMNNGFARKGALKSPRVEALIPEIAGLSAACRDRGIAMLALTDCHPVDSPEFGSYPIHCVCGSEESEIVDELKAVGGYRLIPKNSTNGFHEEAFKSWLLENGKLENFIITGDCTDICIKQVALTLKTWFTMKNIKSRVIIPVEEIDTFDYELHDAELLNVISLYEMQQGGIEIVRNVDIVQNAEIVRNVELIRNVELVQNAEMEF
ncbi:MAG: cysteine hydrolase [Clostridiales bacterium]|nr:cysteine hydrolase [Clostridiales bacterium]